MGCTEQFCPFNIYPLGLWCSDNFLSVTVSLTFLSFSKLSIASGTFISTLFPGSSLFKEVLSHNVTAAVWVYPNQCLTVRFRRGSVSRSLGPGGLRRLVNGVVKGVDVVILLDVKGVVIGVAREAGIPKYISG